MKLEDINTSKFLFDPKEKDFVSNMIKRSAAFDLELGINVKMLLTYVALVYDINSEIRRNARLDYSQRKVEGAITTGFSMKNKRFAKDVERLLLGEDDSFNRAIVEYVCLSLNNDYKLLYVLEENYNDMIKDHSNSVKKFTNNDRKLLTEMSGQIKGLESLLFGGQEVMNARRALYEGTEAIRDRFRLEDAVEKQEKDGLEDWNPFPGYTPDNLSFVGDVIPSS